MTDNGIIDRIRETIIQGRITSDDEGFDEGMEGQPGTLELVDRAIKEGVDVRSILVHGLTEGMQVVGERFEQGIYLIPDMLASAEAVGEAMEMLSPHLAKAGVESKGKVVIATVKGDLHDIGKNIVGTMLKGAGYELIDLGADVPENEIVRTVQEHGARFLGLSALLTTTMREMGTIIKILEEKGIRDQVKVLIGGAPTSAEFARQIGADAHCADAFCAVDYVNSCV